MKAVLTNFGTAGEVYPFFALAQELLMNGHKPILAFSPDYANWAGYLGMDFAPIGPVAKVIKNNLTLAATRNPRLFDSVEEMIELLRPLKATLPQAFQQLFDICQDADVLISGNLQPSAKMVHEKTGIPYVSVCTTYIAAGETSAAYQHSTQWLVNPCRRDLGLRSLRDPLASDSLSDQLVLYALSSHIVSRMSHWPSFYHLAGYFYLDETYWQADNSLVEFLAAGEPPVVISFGSMVYDRPDEMTNIIVETAKALGKRFILQAGWSGLGRNELPPDIYVGGYIPHQWLFSQASCIVHHGGAGTSAAAFRAGIPAVVVPHILDQSLWAVCAEKLGSAGPPLPSDRLTVRTLSEAIMHVLTTPSCRAAALDLATKIRQESGVRRARQLIETIAAQPSRSIVDHES